MTNGKKALVCGAGGFIGSHLVKRLKKEGYWVRGVDLKRPEFDQTTADEFLVLDLREKKNCEAALRLDSGKFDELYQLAADMGGMGFIHSAECEIMHNSALININMIHTAATAGVKRYFFSSSVCIYKNMKSGEPEISEKEAYPAMPDNEYGWEKLYAERMALELRGSRTAMVQKERGEVVVKRHLQPCHARLQRPKMVARSKCGATVAPFAPILI
jgi:nucleoside-diphosphate-sugar epimerase